VSVTRIYHTAWVLSGVLFFGGFVAGGELESPPIFVIGEVGAVLAFVYAMYLSLRVVRGGDPRLLKRGIRGTATVLQAHRTNTVMQAGEFDWMAPWMWNYHLRVTLPGEDPYETVVSICAAIGEGQQVDIAAAPHNHKRVTIDVGQGEGKRKAKGDADALESAISKFSATASSFTASTPAKGGDSKDSIKDLERLADLHDRGVLTDAELAEQKRKLLDES
jgi:hypothetical protein